MNDLLTRRLILMRHAKSDWDDPALADHDRPLNKRGRKAAPRMAQWLSSNGSVPDIILGSTAMRVRETVSLMQEQWQYEATELYCRDLYLAAPETILRVVGSDALDHQTVLLVAHNPGLEELISRWFGSPLRIPTATAAIFELRLSHWHELRWQTALQCVALQRPKELPEVRQRDD